MATSNITLPELFMLIAYLSFPVWCVARVLQWLMLRGLLPTARLALVLAVSLLISFIITVTVWGGWPGSPMAGIICMPALCAEAILLLMSWLIKKPLLKKWRASS